MRSSFETNAEEYDRWYDSPKGQAILEVELSCLKMLCPQFAGRWIEIGVGTGRFASAFGISEGIDPSLQMLEIAKSRGIRVISGKAEYLPFADSTYDGVLLTTALCFVESADESLSECYRILCQSGKCLLGIVPADSPWGRAYMDKARHGHPVYSAAHFRTVTETLELARMHGFELLGTASTLFWAPNQKPPLRPEITAGIAPEAGFVGLLFERMSDFRKR